MLRVGANLAWVIGPSLGGLLVACSYLWIVVADAVASTITTIIVYRLLPGTRPETHAVAGGRR